MQRSWCLSTPSMPKAASTRIQSHRFDLYLNCSRFRHAPSDGHRSTRATYAIHQGIGADIVVVGEIRQSEGALCRHGGGRRTLRAVRKGKSAKQCCAVKVVAGAKGSRNVGRYVAKAGGMGAWLLCYERQCMAAGDNRTIRGPGNANPINRRERNAPLDTN